MALDIIFHEASGNKKKIQLALNTYEWILERVDTNPNDYPIFGSKFSSYWQDSFIDSIDIKKIILELNILLNNVNHKNKNTQIKNLTNLINFFIEADKHNASIKVEAD